jgi:hypothetical protein
VNGENESMEEVDMDGSESDQELTGNETDENVKKFVSNKTKVPLHVLDLLSVHNLRQFISRLIIVFS